MMMVDAYQTILPENATLLEQACDKAFAGYTAKFPVLVPSLWNAETCPENLLGYLAWSMGVEEWDAQWPVDTKRKAIREAPLVNARRGTLWAVQRVLNNAGVFSQLHEWFEQPVTPFSTTEPGTFDITVFVARSITANTDSREVTPEILDRIRRMVDATKPLSRHYNLRAALGIDTQADQAIACIGCGSVLMVSECRLIPHDKEAFHQMCCANVVSIFHLFETNGTLQ